MLPKEARDPRPDGFMYEWNHVLIFDFRLGFFGGPLGLVVPLCLQAACIRPWVSFQRTCDPDDNLLWGQSLVACELCRLTN